MLAIWAALWPLFAYVALGVGLRLLRMPGESFWPGAERLCFHLLMPALIFRSVATAHFVQFSGTLLVLLAGAGVMTALCFLSWKILCRRLHGPGFTSLFQGGVRFNTYVGISASAALYGQAGLAQSAVVLSVLIPLVNLLAILLLTHYGEGSHHRSLRKHATALAGNPIILSCLFGMLWNLAGIGMPKGLDDLLRQLGDAGIVLGLLAVGAALDVERLKGQLGVMALATVLKLAVFPLVMAFFCLMFGVEGLAARVLMVFASLPTASMGYIMARRMGGDAELMAGILLLETALAALTMPLVIGWAEGLFPL